MLQFTPFLLGGWRWIRALPSRPSAFPFLSIRRRKSCHLSFPLVDLLRHPVTPREPPSWPSPGAAPRLWVDSAAPLSRARPPASCGLRVSGCAWGAELCFKASNACPSSCWHVSYWGCAKARVRPEDVDPPTSDSATLAWEGNHFVQDSSCMYLNPDLVISLHSYYCVLSFLHSGIRSCFVLPMARHSLTWNTWILLH